MSYTYIEHTQRFQEPQGSKSVLCTIKPGLCVTLAGMCAGLAGRVGAQGPNEDEEGMSEPSEVAEFLSELGEGDPRCPLLLMPESSLSTSCTILSAHEV